MYVNSTPVQVARAVAVWVTGFGAALLALVFPNIFTGNDPGVVVAAVVPLALGIATIVWARWRLKTLDARNRPYLLSEAGVTVLAARAVFSRRVVIVKRGLLGLFLAAGTVFVVLVSAVNCQDDSRGFCAAVATPSEALLTATQALALGLGLLYIGAVVLLRTHDAESERLDTVIAEGQRRRRDDGPLAGVRTRGWDY